MRKEKLLTDSFINKLLHILEFDKYSLVIDLHPTYNFTVLNKEIISVLILA